MKSMVALLLTVVAGSAAAQVRPFVTAGVGELWAARYGYQDVAQHGSVTALGGGAGLSFRTGRPLGWELSLEHFRSGDTQLFDVNFLPTGQTTPIATVTNLGLALRMGSAAGAVQGRLGGILSRQRGDVVLGRHEARVGLRGGIVASPFSVGRLRPGFELNLTRYLNGTAGLRWIVAPGFRVGF